MSEAVFQQVVCIGAEHPSLPGHFPGRPLVPGVVLLEHVASALRHWRGQVMTGVVEAKFMLPLLPGQVAMVQLTPAASTAAGGRVRFEIRRDDQLLARGVVEGAI